MIVPYQESGDEYLMLKNLAKYFRHKFAIGRKWTNDRMLKNVSFKVFKVENVPSFKGLPVKKNELINEAIKTGDLYSGGMYCFAVVAIVLLFSNSSMYFQGGYSGFQVTGMIELSQKSRPPKNPWGFQENPKKSLDQKLTPKNSHADFVALKSSRKG